jgi:hypothetical protein
MFNCLPNQMQGFAHGAGESANPFLWNQMVLSMAPCMGVGGVNCPDLSPSRYGSAIVGLASAFSITGSPIGPAFRFNGNVAQQWVASTWGLPTKIFGGAAGTIECTVQVFFRYVHKESATTMCLFRTDNVVGLGSSNYGWGVTVEANTDDLILFANRGNGLDPDPYRQWKLASGNPATTLTGGKWHSAIITYSATDQAYPLVGQVVMMNLDGKWVYPSVPLSEIVPVYNLALNARCGSMRGATAPDFEIALLNVWARRLCWQEIAQLQADPLMMFQQKKTSLGFHLAALTLSLSDSVTSSDTKLNAPQAVKADAVELSDTASKAAISSSTDTISLSDSEVQSVGKALTDTVMPLDTETVLVGQFRADTLTPTDELTIQSHQTHLDTVDLSDVLGKIVTLSRSDSVLLLDVFTLSIGLFLSLQDIIGPLEDGFSLDPRRVPRSATFFVVGPGKLELGAYGPGCPGSGQ